MHRLTRRRRLVALTLAAMAPIFAPQAAQAHYNETYGGRIRLPLQ